jgi:hypothetical protein
VSNTAQLEPFSTFRPKAIEPLALQFLGGSVVVVSDDETRAVYTPEDGSPIQDGSRIVELQSGDASADPDESRLWTSLAHCNPADLAC